VNVRCRRLSTWALYSTSIVLAFPVVWRGVVPYRCQFSYHKKRINKKDSLVCFLAGPGKLDVGHVIGRYIWLVADLAFLRECLGRVPARCVGTMLIILLRTAGNCFSHKSHFLF